LRSDKIFIPSCDTQDVTPMRQAGTRLTMQDSQRSKGERERYLDPKSNTLGHFWVDALCIDQNNIPEKNSQVSKMKEIYEGAKKIVVWLGPAADDK
jgi:hypothetical protein